MGVPTADMLVFANDREVIALIIAHVLARTARSTSDRNDSGESAIVRGGARSSLARP
jgi:hypothetical protein